MATLMTWETSGGKKGRCDAKCHGATGSVCRCMCGGRYHGAAHRPGGVEQAVRDTWEEAIEQAEQKAKAEGMELDTSRLRKFIGLEDEPMIKLKAELASGSYHGEIAVQGRFPLEVM